MVRARDWRPVMLQQAFTSASCTLNTLMQCSPLKCAQMLVFQITLKI